MPPNFTQVRLREGYDMDEVDAYLAQVVGRLRRGRPDAALAEEIGQARFKHVRLRAGYDMDEVDLYLDELTVRAREGR